MSSKFKAGDRVCWTRDNDLLPKGAPGSVISITEGVLIRFDSFYVGHSLWYCSCEHLTLISSTSPSKTNCLRLQKKLGQNATQF